MHLLLVTVTFTSCWLYLWELWPENFLFMQPRKQEAYNWWYHVIRYKKNLFGWIWLWEKMKSVTCEVFWGDFVIFFKVFWICVHRCVVLEYLLVCMLEFTSQFSLFLYFLLLFITFLKKKILLEYFFLYTDAKIYRIRQQTVYHNY